MQRPRLLTPRRVRSERGRNRGRQAPRRLLGVPVPVRTVKLAGVAIVLALTACAGEADDTRSGDGPAVKETSTTTGGSGDEDPETTTTEAAAAPSTSPSLAIVGKVTVPD